MQKYYFFPIQRTNICFFVYALEDDDERACWVKNVSLPVFCLLNSAPAQQRNNLCGAFCFDAHSVFFFVMHTVLSALGLTIVFTGGEI